MGFNVRDALLKLTKALPNGAATVVSDGIDLGHGSFGDFLANIEFKLSAPVLTTTELPNGQTVTYSLEHDDNADFSTVATLQSSLLVQTGAGGAGAAAASKTFRLPLDVKRHVRIKAVNSGAGDASGKSLTFEVLF